MAADLLRAAAEARAHAYAPYSGFPVGAAIRTAGGRIFVGCNVENAAFPQGQCAEATAIGAMIMAGEREIAEVAVVGSGKGLCPPCGGCRQRLAEFGGPMTRVHLGSPEGLLRAVFTLGELLPHAFAAGNLGQAQDAVEPAAAAAIRERAGGFAPTVALVLGSGLGGIADRVEDPLVIDYRDLPGFPRPSVAGHAGRLLLGRLAGVPVACLSGRAHLYEGIGSGPVNAVVRTLQALGCKGLLLTNAAGSLHAEIGPGALVLIDDHINLQGTNPLVGPNDERIGPRFVDLTEVYAAHLRDRLAAAAARLSIPLSRGVYLATLGPCFETPAEIRAWRAFGADLVGMSTVQEAIAARHAGLLVAAVSIVTNLAAGLTPDALSHAETLDRAAAAADRLGDLFETALPEIALALA
jgi:xanthosine phosphorylase